MSNNFFAFKQFTIRQEKSVFKVGTDGVLLGACSDLQGAASILDIGTGTGLIAMMCAQRSDANITAIEPESDSYSEACENVSSCKWASRINVMNTDLQSFTGNQLPGYDVLICNPPYFRDSLRNPDKMKAASRHAYSLTSNDLLSSSDYLLSFAGSLQIILPYEEGAIFIAEAGAVGFYCNSLIKVKPFPEGKIIRLIMKFEREKKQPYEKYLTIEAGTRHRYTEEYKELTRDFYLNF